MKAPASRRFPLLLLAFASIAAWAGLTSAAQAQIVLYRQVFGRGAVPADQVLTGVNWAQYKSATAILETSNSNLTLENLPSVPDNVGNVNSSKAAFSETVGYARLAITNTQVVALTIPNATEVAAFSGVDMDPANYASLTFSWIWGFPNPTNPSSLAANVFSRLAIEIGGNWYATDATFSATSPTEMSVVFDPTAPLWRDLTFVPGGTLSLAGTARTLDLPSGEITNFGIFAENGNTFTKTTGYDTFQVVGVPIPEPSAALFLGLGSSGLAVVARRRRLS